MANCCYGSQGQARVQQVRIAPAPKLTYKISILGDANIGKTSLVHRLVHNCLLEEVTPTSGVGYSTYDVSCDSRTVPCEIWDTAGQERFGALVPVYIRGTDLCLIAVPLTEAYEARLIQAERWTRILRSVSEEARIVVIGTKADLASSDMLIPDVTVATSSVSGLGVAELRAIITAEISSLALSR